MVGHGGTRCAPSQQRQECGTGLETARFRGTGGVSENNRSLGFQPAFIDRETQTVQLSRFPDGRLAPCHLLDGLAPVSGELPVKGVPDAFDFAFISDPEGGLSNVPSAFINP